MTIEWKLLSSVLFSWTFSYYAVQGGSNFLVCGWNLTVWPFKWKLLISCGAVYNVLYHLFCCCYYVIVLCNVWPRTYKCNWLAFLFDLIVTHNRLQFIEMLLRVNIMHPSFSTTSLLWTWHWRKLGQTGLFWAMQFSNKLRRTRKNWLRGYAGFYKV